MLAVQKGTGRAHLELRNALQRRGVLSACTRETYVAMWLCCCGATHRLSPGGGLGKRVSSNYWIAAAHDVCFFCRAAENARFKDKVRLSCACDRLSFVEGRRKLRRNWEHQLSARFATSLQEYLLEFLCEEYILCFRARLHPDLILLHPPPSLLLLLLTIN